MSVSRSLAPFSATAAFGRGPPPRAAVALAPWAATTTATRGPAAALAAGRPVLLPQERLPRQIHAVLVVDGDHLHLQPVADLADVLDLLDVLVAQLADVTQAVAAGQDLDEGAEVLDRRHPALVHL